ncbi:aromatic-ring-hydroxylating dioxygenase subunit beta [Rhodococcus sp. IEGM 1381]|uniref:aromatic-ring-hydroxylating dioxygenase subunit beta n=1 Tax=Rhodococcus sp. IEGM 1381 TaxID=3047085 RepID=UPI0024B7024F|nr:aromatic-ring-hydroxylating dioxygenase subunit beta [Rhodococcus sp. IEGM 1381]MDI9897434.1 aromatic-ring-hydroxylating dioxygenase subunit beta [Rhodococcus sp. IEGM 1381]
MTGVNAAKSACGNGSALHNEVLDWITREVHLLDSGLLDDWYATLHPEISYMMPVRLSLMPKDGAGFRDDMDYYMDDHASIRMRINRLATNMAWAEQPGSRTRHLVTNTTVAHAGDDYAVTSQFFVTRARSDQTPDLFPGRRDDVLTRAPNGELLLRNRRILLDQTVLKSFNLSFFI